MIPVKRVVSINDLEAWKTSPACESITSLVVSLQNSVVGLTNDSDLGEPSDACCAILSALDNVDALIDSNPVVADAHVSRFGKSEFRDFYDSVTRDLQSYFSDLAPNYLDEVCTYFNESWGNRTRIDYGLGHELNFMCFLLSLDKMEILRKTDYATIVLKIFTRYMSIMRRLQRIYWLEPAGLHGVWGLDDYHFLPFLFGAAQLATHPHMKPKLIHNDELVEMYHKQYMYFECIYFINSIKTLPLNQSQKLSLRWHSPMLDDISLARLWLKIKEGMVKMYKADVLGKLPIVQHFMFGELIPCPDGITLDHGNQVDEACGHVHARENVSTWGECCGIKVPSAIAASESLRLNSQKKSKPVPFD